jgi:PadR family transcriptional regulator, regulatory protein PadR
MGKSAQPTLLQGTLDLLILHALQRGALHGYAIAQTIHLLSDEVLKVEEGSLYPALYRLELDGAIAAEWGLSENNRKAKYYRITKRGQKLVTEQEAIWNRLSTAVGRVLARWQAMYRFFLKLWRRRRLQQDLETELAFHREMSRRQPNHIPLGNITAIKEEALDLWRFPLVENLWRDLRYAARGLRRTSALVLSALLSLASLSKELYCEW